MAGKLKPTGKSGGWQRVIEESGNALYPDFFPNERALFLTEHKPGDRLPYWEWIARHSEERILIIMGGAPTGPQGLPSNWMSVGQVS